ncbi:MAG: DUF4625 domain-containing protein [Reichenbachiella sp.]|uniref:DUF4625 domain-containing protein n=1 Tax=Reichenbachiella sp. TaxID=2184521 RepID=UPI00326715D3
MKKTKNWLLAILILPAFYSCDDDDTVDTSAPQITLEDPVNGEAVAAGTAMDVHADLEDDVNLATYSITIHDNFDGHAHGRLLVENFSFSESYEVEGTDTHVIQEVNIDAEATAGPYHFIMEAIDAAGNATSFQDDSSIEIEIWITNETMAHIHLMDANDAEIDELEGTLGEALAIYGEVEDESGTLDHVLISVGHLEEEAGADGHDHGRILEDNIFEEEYEVEGETSVLLQDLLANESIIITQADLDELEEEEHLYLIVQATDGEGNISRNAIEIHFD